MYFYLNTIMMDGGMVDCAQVCINTSPSTVMSLNDEFAPKDYACNEHARSTTQHVASHSCVVAAFDMLSASLLLLALPSSHVLLFTHGLLKAQLNRISEQHRYILERHPLRLVASKLATACMSPWELAGVLLTSGK